MAPKRRGLQPPPIDPDVFFQTYWPRQVGYTLCMNLKFDTYNHLDTMKSSQKFRGIFNIFDVFMTSSMSDVYVILQFLATASVIKCVETLDFHVQYVF